MCNCSNTDLLMWGGGAGLVAYFATNGNTIAVGAAVAAGILYRRHQHNNNNRNNEHVRPYY